MNEAMQCYSEQKPLSFDLKKHLQQLEDFIELPTKVTNVPLASPQKIAESQEERTHVSETQVKTSEFETIRVSLQNLERVSVYTEEIQAIKIAIEEYYSKLAKMNFNMDTLIQSWKKIGRI